MMKWNKIKKAGVLLLAAALLTAMMPVLPKISAPVYGTEPKPTMKTFANKEELLKNFDLDDRTKDKTIQPVYFGKNKSSNPLKWYIAGEDPGNGGLVLYAADPLPDERIRFNENEEAIPPYDAAWGCDYGAENAPTNVYANYYGNSIARSTLKAMETNTTYFSTAEQALMKTTTIATYDEKNQVSYTTEDKLYLAYGDLAIGEDRDDDKYVTVGTNNKEDLNGGLRIELRSGPYSEKRDEVEDMFHLRTASPIWVGKQRLVVRPDKLGPFVDGFSVIVRCHLLPACSLDMTQVLFAAAAPAAAEGEFDLQDALTFRYEDAGLDSAYIDFTRFSIQVTDAPTENTYLVVQNDSGAWAKKVEDAEFSVGLGDVSMNGKPLFSFTGCRAWLETTDPDTQMLKATPAVAAPPPPMPSWYPLTVHNGSGSGYYTYGQKVNITADPAPEGMRFKEWTTTAGTIEDPKAETTTFTMPIGGAEVTAVYENDFQLTAPIKVSTTYNSARLTWKAVKDAEGYQIYRASSKNGTYKRIATTSKTTFTNKKLTTGKTYYYKVRAYGSVDGIRQYGEFSKAVKGVPKIKAPSFSLKSGNNSIKISWKGVSGATGYRIYRASSKKGTFKLIKVTGSKARSYTSYKLKNRHTYYYKIRSYRLVNGKKIYSNYSIVKSKKTR